MAITPGQEEVIQKFKDDQRNKPQTTSGARS